jgi:hypothetical protein
VSKSRFTLFSFHHFSQSIKKTMEVDATPIADFFFASFNLWDCVALCVVYLQGKEPLGAGVGERKRGHKGPDAQQMRFAILIRQAVTQVPFTLDLCEGCSTLVPAEQYCFACERRSCLSCLQAFHRDDGLCGRFMPTAVVYPILGESSSTRRSRAKGPEDRPSVRALSPSLRPPGSCCVFSVPAFMFVV